MTAKDLTIIISDPEGALEKKLLQGENHLFSDGISKWVSYTDQREFNFCLVDQFWIFDNDEWEQDALREVGGFINGSRKNLVFIYFHLGNGPSAAELREMLRSHIDINRVEIEDPIGFHHTEGDSYYPEYIRPAFEKLVGINTLGSDEVER